MTVVPHAAKQLGKSELERYLQRIGYSGHLEPNLETLVGVHRAHLLQIPYENLDIHLGRTLELGAARAFEKIVSEGRGGWCYEMNGLLAWALSEIGFDVELLACAVGQNHASANHLALRVNLEQPYLADAGFGNGILEPIPLVPGVYTQQSRAFNLERNDKTWTFHMPSTEAKAVGNSFEFSLEPQRLEHFQNRCTYLQTSPESGFVRLVVAHRMTEMGVQSLRGAVLQTVQNGNASSRTLESHEDYDAVLHEVFDLHLDTSALWSKVWTAHLAWLENLPSPAQTR
jgi:N-hydroxyarylamine O-acetyltransferase